MNLASRILAGSMASLVILAPHPTVTAAPSEARVTQIIRDVKLLPSDADARPAVVDDTVTEDTALRTGGESRSELTFADLTITRLGADTIFSFSKAGRTAKLDSGSILLRVPKDSRGGAIKTNTVTVAITGTTVIFESDAAGNSKLITLEGRARLSLVKDPRRVRNVRAGQMLEVPPGATALPVPVEVDLDELMKTHPLITDFAPLPSQNLIAAVAQQQHKSSPGGRPGIRPPPSPIPSATRPRHSPSPTPRIVTPTPTPSPRPSVTPTPRSPTPTPSPIPSVTPTPKSVTPTASPRRSPTPRPTPTPSPTSDYNNDSPQTPRPSPTRSRYDPAPPPVTPTPKPIVTPTARPSPSRFPSLPPRVMSTPFKPTPSPFPILRSTPASSPQIRKRVSPTPNPRASPTPVNPTRVSPTLKKAKPTATPGIR